MSHPIRDHICEKVAITIYYRPQRSWAKVIFSQACVKNSVHRGGRVSASVHAGIHPPSRPPKDQTPQRRHPPRADPPRADTPLGPGTPPPEQTPTPRDQTPGADTHTSGTRHPPGQTPPRPDPPRDQTLDCSIRSTSGRYASYWNAFLVYMCDFFNDNGYVRYVHKIFYQVHGSFIMHGPTFENTFTWISST